MADGTVTLPLDQYLAMEDELRELRKLKTELAEEKAKTWKIFGAFFDQPRKIDTLQEMDDTYLPKTHFRLRYNNPVTTVTFNEEPFFTFDDENKGLIIKMLIDRHISDVIKGIDFSKVEFRKW